MSRFSRINTKKERKRIKGLLEELRKQRSAVRVESLLQYLSEGIKQISVAKQYRRKIGQKDLKLHAWNRYDNGYDPQGIAPEKSREFQDIVLEVIGDIDRVGIRIEKACVKPKRGKKFLWQTYSLIYLGQIVIFLPKTQLGVGKFFFAAAGFGIERIKELMDDLRIDVLTLSVGMPEWLEEEKSQEIERQDLVGYGDYLLL